MRIGFKPSSTIKSERMISGVANWEIVPAIPQAPKPVPLAKNIHSKPESRVKLGPH